MASDFISIRGARQNNLKDLDLDLPLGKLTVITGLSGSGKSSLAFDTLYAEGQRRYVETFSPYTRQFLERMDKPEVDHIDGIPPAIAIEQSNPVKTSRSTIGTMTEIADYLKMLFTRLGRLEVNGRDIRPHHPEEIAHHLLTHFPQQDILVGFPLNFEQQPSLASTFHSLRQQGFLRCFLQGKILRTDEAVPSRKKTPQRLTIIQDRLRLEPENLSRLHEALENALRHGQGVVWIASPSSAQKSAATSQEPLPTTKHPLLFSNRWYDPTTETEYEEPNPSLFSFNNPLGACPSCRGFGRIIRIDHNRALPDPSLSIAQGVVKPWQSGSSTECQKDLLRACRRTHIPIKKPFQELTPEQQHFVIHGEVSSERSLSDVWESGGWYGVQGFFDWLETKAYKMHVRVLLSRYRTYQTCPDCSGQRFQPQTLRFHLLSSSPSPQAPSPWKANLATLNHLPLTETRTFLQGIVAPPGDDATTQLLQEIHSRLHYLIDVGLGYLTLDRPTRTLSGGEIERVNLTSCLGNSLVHTLFVLDEPSIGLHPRDTTQLIQIVHRLRDRGNTVVVVEHDDTFIQAADHLLDLGPGRGEKGGSIVFEGPLSQLPHHPESCTGQYLTGKKTIPLPTQRRKRKPSFQLSLRKASAHNIHDLNVDIPLGLFVGISGVSGSGKSSLIHDLLYTHLLHAKNQSAEDLNESSTVHRVLGADFISSIHRIDQSPLSKTPRSNPALYLGLFDEIRRLFAATEGAHSQGRTAADFSFNTGQGRCPRCRGTGYEKIEMQFLADVFTTCPSCQGKRFQPSILNIHLHGCSIHDLLQKTASEALAFFSSLTLSSNSKIIATLNLLDEIGLGYLRLGQPLTQLSGGEAQRIKLLRYLSDFSTPSSKKTPPSSQTTPSTRLFLLDEPTTGLHFDDIRLLLSLFQRLVEQGDSLLVIEHNLDVLKSVDWLIDLGPEAGTQGGQIIAQGPPEKIAQNPQSHTGRYLQEKLQPPRRRSPRLQEKSSTLSPKLPADSSLPPQIQIRGARHHNLKNISLDLPLEAMTVITGLSGSGKSTLAFDLLFAEGQRRYLDSLNAYARQFVEQLERPDVDSILGLPPAVAIEQRLTRGGRKSTVATITEIYQFLRLLFAKIGHVYDPETGERATRQTPEAIFHQLEKYRQPLTLLAPLIKARKGYHTEIAKWAEKKGFPLLRVDGQLLPPSSFQALNRFQEHTIEANLGDFNSASTPAERQRLVEATLELGHGTLYYLDAQGHETILSLHLYCPNSGRSFEELDPRLFSFNSIHGWCPTCQGYGYLASSPLRGKHDTELEQEMALEQTMETAVDDSLSPCPDCHTHRLNPLALAVRLPGSACSIGDISSLTIEQALPFFSQINFSGRDHRIARDILPEIIQRLQFLQEVGLGYLTLNRPATTLSGGESQRIRLAAQLGSNLQGVLYVLDEPTIGLHPRDNQRLLQSLQALKQKGNTLIIVEHDEDTIRQADQVIDLGPGAGKEGGYIVAQGPWKKLIRHDRSLTGKLLGQPLRHPLRGARRPLNRSTSWITVQGACAHNLKKINLRLPQQRFTVLCGVSGSGKSTLLFDVLQPALTPGKRKSTDPQPWKKITVPTPFTQVYTIDQSPMGKTSRSTPATYIGLMKDLRALFAQLPLARQRGYLPGHFSFNSGNGRCPQCQGQGTLKIEMNFLPPTFIPCEACRGQRYQRETLEVHYHHRSIADVLHMTAAEAAIFFEAVPRLHRPLQLLTETGLGYLTLGQPSPTLSGGEAQRIQLVAELSKSLHSNLQQRLRRSTQPHNLYLLEEPTIGLHGEDVQKLLTVIHQLVDAGHTVLVIEHHLNVIAEADYLIELGPEGGEQGGRLLAQGTPEKVATQPHSPTAPYLQAILHPQDSPS